MNYSKHELKIFKLSNYDEEKHEFKIKSFKQKLVDKRLSDYPFPCSFDIQKAIIEGNNIKMNCKYNSFKINLD